VNNIVLIPDDFNDRPMWVHASGDAIATWLAALAWCSRNESWEGVIPSRVLGTLCNVRSARRSVVELERIGAVHPGPHGEHVIVDATLYIRRPPKGRRYISRITRRSVHDRDGWLCVDCGANGALTLDHVFPWSLGGSDEESNLQTMCRPCNSRKGAKV
jgi:hypothetical protein